MLKSFSTLPLRSLKRCTGLDSSFKRASNRSGLGTLTNGLPVRLVPKFTEISSAQSPPQKV